MARRRFQRGSVYQNQAKTVWLGMYSEYVLDSNGVERRRRKSVVLGPIRKPNGEEMRKREAQRLFQPYVDRVNSSISGPSREHKSVTFDAFAVIWERDYLSLSKPSTQATMRGQAKRLKAFFGSKELRQIGAADAAAARCQDGCRWVRAKDDSQPLGDSPLDSRGGSCSGLYRQNGSEAKTPTSVQEKAPILPYSRRCENHCRVKIGYKGFLSGSRRRLV